MEESVEKELIRRAKEGDREAFDSLAAEHLDRIYRLALRLTGNEHAAEGVTQDVLVQAYRALPRFDGRSRLMTWLYVIAVRKALDMQRARRGRHEAVSLSDWPDMAADGRRSAPSDPVAIVREHELNALLEDAMMKLPAEQRTALVLVVMEGLSYGDAAEAMGCPENTVVWRVWRARQVLRELMGRHLDG